MKTFKQLLEDLQHLIEATESFDSIKSKLAKGDLSSFKNPDTGKLKTPSGLFTTHGQEHLHSLRNDPSPAHKHVQDFLKGHYSNPEHEDFATKRGNHKGSHLKGIERTKEQMRGFKKSQEGAKSEEPAKEVASKVDYTAEHAAKAAAAKAQSDKTNATASAAVKPATVKPAAVKPAAVKPAAKGRKTIKQLKDTHKLPVAHTKDNVFGL